MLKRILFVFLFLLIPSISYCDFQGKVIAVKDGDTIVVLGPGDRPVTVRLAEIDSPEMSQAFGKNAKQFTSDMVYGDTVTVKEKGKDEYGRTIGTVYMQNGLSLNEELVRNGYAWQYRQYSKSASLKALEVEARAEKIGLWQDDNPEPPWEYRHSEKGRRGGDHASGQDDFLSADGYRYVKGYSRKDGTYIEGHFVKNKRPNATQAHHSGTTYVKGYIKKDGTYVKGYYKGTGVSHSGRHRQK